MREVGLTLIEMMIVILLIGILALLATPLTSGWINSARLGEAQGALEQAVGQAKAVALRNEAGMQTTSAASKICLIDGVLSVHSATPPVGATAAVEAKCDSSKPAIWSIQMPPNITLKIGTTTAWTCSCFTNTALLTNANANCTSCGTSLIFNITSGSENEPEVKIY